MPEQIILEFVGDMKGLQNVVDGLKAIGQISEEQYAAFNKANATAAQNMAKFDTVVTKTEKDTKAAAKSVGDLNAAFKGVNQTIAVSTLDDFLKALAVTLPKLSNEANVAAEKTQSLKSELRGLKEELALLEAQGDDSSQKFIDLSVRAAELEDQIGDTSARIRRMASDTRAFDLAVEGLRGGTAVFTGLTSAAALFGNENENLQKALLKVQAAHAALTSVQEIANIVTTKGGIATKALQFIQEAWAKSSAASMALATGGLTLLTGFVALLVVNWDNLTSSTKKQQEAQEALNNANKEANEILKTNLSLQKSVSDERVKHAEDVINDLKAQGGSIEELRKAEERLDNERVAAADKELRALGSRLYNFNQYKDQYLKSQQDMNDRIATLQQALSTETAIQVRGKWIRGEEVKKEIDIIKAALDNLTTEINVVQGAINNYSNSVSQQINNNIQRAREAQLEALQGDILAAEIRVANAASFSRAELNAKLGLIKAKQELDEQQVANDANREKNILLIQARSYVEQRALMRAFDEQHLNDKLVALEKRIKAEEDFYNRVLKMVETGEKKIKDETDKRLSAGILTPEQRAQAQQDVNDLIKNTTLSAEQQTEAAIYNLQQFAKNYGAAIIQVAQTISDTIFQIQAEARQFDLDEQLAHLEEKYQMEIEYIERTKDMALSNKYLTEYQRRNIERHFDDEREAAEKRKRNEEKKLKTEAFEADKRAKLASAAINTALAVINAFATAPWPVSIVMAAVAAATGAAQIAIIASQKTPKFAKGTEQAPPGFKWVGEEGPELIHDKGGYAIMSNPDSMKLMAKYKIPALPDNSSVTMPVINESLIQQQYKLNHTGIDYAKMAQAIGEEFRSSPQTHLSFDKNGMAVHFVERGRKVTNLNTIYKG